MKRENVVIPNNHIAKLMYYLNSIHTCADLVISSRLLDFRNHSFLSEVERRDVVIYAHRYRPSVLNGILFFQVPSDSYLLPHSANNFLELDDATVISSFNLPSNVIIVDGAQHIVKRVMIYKFSWINDYFDVPYEHENWRIGLSPKPGKYVGTVTTTTNRRHGGDVPLWCIGGILCCFIFPPVGLCLLCVGACRAGEEAAAPPTSETTYVVY